MSDKRRYTFRNRSKVDLTPKCFPPSEEAVKHLADEIFQSYFDDGSVAYACLDDIRDVEMLDILREELRDFPSSPVSVELRRRLKTKALEEAVQVASKVYVLAISD